MKFVMYQDCVSPHQVPLARELVKRLGVDNFRYVYRDEAQGERIKLGWKMDGDEPWFVHIGSHPEMARDLIENADAELMMFRDPDLVARRCAKGLKTFYASERWLKPILIKVKVGGGGVQRTLSLPGILKLLSPSYLKLAMQMTKLILAEPNFYYLPIGPHAARDMSLLCRFIHPLATDKRQLATKFIPWGYFVEEGKGKSGKVNRAEGSPLKVLYVGRLLALKRVDTIIRAVAYANKLKSGVEVENRMNHSLTVMGSGPEESRLRKLASSFRLQLPASDFPAFTFRPPVPIGEVRAIMRAHDVLVFASNAFDGWGAVVSEALSEGVPVIGTYETGASAALLPDSQLFHCGDYRTLADKLSALRLQCSTATNSLPPAFTPSGAIDRLFTHA